MAVVAAIVCGAQLPLKNLNLKLTSRSTLDRLLQKRQMPRRTFRVPVAVTPEIDSLFEVEAYYNYGSTIPGKDKYSGKYFKFYEYHFDVIFRPKVAISSQFRSFEAYLGNSSGKMVKGLCSSRNSDGVIVGKGYGVDWDTPHQFWLDFYNRPPAGAVCVVIRDELSKESDPLVWYDAKGNCIAGGNHAYSSGRDEDNVETFDAENADSEYYWVGSADSCQKVSLPMLESEVPLMAVCDSDSRKDGFIVHSVTLRKASADSDGQSLDDYQLIINVTPSNSLGINGDPLLNLFVCGVFENDISVIKHQRFDDRARDNLMKNLKADGTVDIVVSAPFMDPENIKSLRGVVVTPFSYGMIGLVSLFNDGKLKFPE